MNSKELGNHLSAKRFITEDYNYNPCANPKHINIICAGFCVSNDGAMRHRVDCEYIETGMVYTYEIDAKLYAKDYTKALTSPDNKPISGFFKYANEIDQEGIDNLIGTNYPQKRLLIYCALTHQHSLGHKIAKSMDEDTFKI